MATQPKPKNIVNGVDVDQYLQTVDSIKSAPAIAKFKFRIRNTWLEAGHNRSIVNQFYGAGSETTRKKAFVLDAYEPPVLLGKDKAANPAEYLARSGSMCNHIDGVSRGGSRRCDRRDRILDRRQLGSPRFSGTRQERSQRVPGHSDELQNQGRRACGIDNL